MAHFSQPIAISILSASRIVERPTAYVEKILRQKAVCRQGYKFHRAKLFKQMLLNKLRSLF
ncbi:hypothetical protein ABD86_15735 [Paenibacillus alvei]|nr:hypothetical protein [Paenibacillus alvei]MBG9745299.1 hypothetical protein [Paenibacillus alvei]